jgi:hypothetical protein
MSASKDEDYSSLFGKSFGNGRDSENKSAKDNDKDMLKIYQAKYSNKLLLAESVLIAGEPYFLVTRAGEITIETSIQLTDNKILMPLEIESYLSKPYSFPSSEEVQQYIRKAKNENLDTLYNTSKSLWSKYVDGDGSHIALCAADSIYTYFQDKIGLTHYLFFVGNTGAGKSNNLLLINFVGYRNLSTDVTPANVYQFLGIREEGQGTICEDEADDIDTNTVKMRIYKNGYTKGHPVARIDTSEGRKQNRYFTFGFKAFAAERLPDSLKAKGLAERSITILCMHGNPLYDISEIVNPAGEQEHQRLLDELMDFRNTMLTYRLLHYHEAISDVKLNISNREKQLFKPIIRIFHKTDAWKNELRFVVSKYISQRRSNNAESLNAFLYKLVIDLISAQKTTQLPSGLIWKTLMDVLPGQRVIGRDMTFNSEEFGDITHKQITGILTQIFGAVKSPGHSKGNALIFDQGKLDRAGKVYQLNVGVEVKTIEEQGVVSEKKDEKNDAMDTGIDG